MYLFALDIGTSACKASLVREDLSVADSALAPYDTRSPRPGWAEQDADDWWRASVKASRLLLERNPAAGGEVAGIGVSGHMLGLLPVDGRGAPLRPAMIHADTRAAQELRELEENIGAQALYVRSGNVPSAACGICKALWLSKNEPEVYRRAARLLQSKDYVTAKMTGDIDVTDYSDASHALLMDVHQRRYLTDVFAELWLDAAKFPALRRGTDIAGRLLPEAARELGLPCGIPVAAGGGDGACANIGAGVAAPGDVYCSLGTTAWIAYGRGAPLIDGGQRVFNIMSLDGEGFGVFGTTQSAGRVVTWAQQLFGLESPAELDRLAALAPPGCGGLTLLPYLEGERSPIFDPRARGVYFGITPAHRREHFLRAALEGVACALRSILEVLREQEAIDELRIIGGGAKSPLWKQIIADLCEAAVADVTSDAASATSLGAAAAAGVGIGLFPNLAAAAKLVGVRRRTLPQPARFPAYRESFAQFTELYPRLKPVYHRGE